MCIESYNSFGWTFANWPKWVSWSWIEREINRPKFECCMIIAHWEVINESRIFWHMQNNETVLCFFTVWIGKLVDGIDVVVLLCMFMFTFNFLLIRLTHTTTTTVSCANLIICHYWNIETSAKHMNCFVFESSNRFVWIMSEITPNLCTHTHKHKVQPSNHLLSRLSFTSFLSFAIFRSFFPSSGYAKLHIETGHDFLYESLFLCSFDHYFVNFFSHFV